MAALHATAHLMRLPEECDHEYTENLGSYTDVLMFKGIDIGSWRFNKEILDYVNAAIAGVMHDPLNEGRELRVSFRMTVRR
jgi:hypothetical protein